MTTSCRHSAIPCMETIKRLLAPKTSLQIQVSLNSDLVLVHPDQDGEEVGMTMLAGHVLITSSKLVRIATVRAGVVVTARYIHPKLGTQHGTLYEQYQSYLGEDAIIQAVNDKVQHRIQLNLPVESSAPTFENGSRGDVRAQLKVIVEYWGDKGEDTEVIGKGIVDVPKLNMAHWNGGTVNYPIDYNKDHSYISTINVEDRVDPRTRRQVMVDDLAIISSPDRSGLPTLRTSKTGQIAGLGLWTLSIRSNLFTIGSYIQCDLAFQDVPSSAVIYAYRLALEEICEATPISTFKEIGVHGEWTAHPPKEWPLGSEGVLPAQSACFSGGGATAWRTGKLRLPGDTVMRSSTCQGTSSPLRYSHALILRVYFAEASVNDGSVTMMQTRVPVFVANCCCIKERVSLPQYCSTTCAPQPLAPLCACCYALENLPDVEPEETPVSLPGKEVSPSRT